MNTISVVIPLYNKGPHIEAAIRSIQDQSHQANEIIVVDDGSTDDGAQTVKRLAVADQRIKLSFRSPPGPGGYAARNEGVAAATSEWVAFLDADDLWYKDHLRLLLQAVESAGPNVGCAFSAVTVVEEGGRRDYKGTSNRIPASRTLSLDNILEFWLASGLCPLWTGATMFRKSVLVEAGLFPAGKALRGGDKDMWLRAVALSPAVFSGERTAEFHQDTVNRVTKTTGHVQIPIVTRTAMELIARSKPRTQSLLKKLINQELVQYARFAAGKGAPAGVAFFRSYQYDHDFSGLLKLLSYSLVGQLMRLRFRLFATNSR